MSKKIRAGNLRNIITVQREVISFDTMGGEVKTWVNIEVTRASINPITGREFYLDSHILNDVDQQIVMRYTDIVPADRMIFGVRIFDIKKILDFDERKHLLTILAKERLGEKYASASVPLLLEDAQELAAEDQNILVTEGL